MTFSEKYCRACVEREVPTSVLLNYLEQLRGKPDEEQIAMKDRFALEIEATYPYKPGKEPKEEA